MNIHYYWNLYYSQLPIPLARTNEKTTTTTWK